MKLSSWWSREVVESPSLEILKAWLRGALDSITQALLSGEGWTTSSPEFTSNMQFFVWSFFSLTFSIPMIFFFDLNQWAIFSANCFYFLTTSHVVVMCTPAKISTVCVNYWILIAFCAFSSGIRDALKYLTEAFQSTSEGELDDVIENVIDAVEKQPCK